jgi:hypothetical protein
MAISPRAPRGAPFSNPAATLSLPLASTTRRRHSQTDNEQGPSPIIESIRGPHAGGEHNGRRRPATTCSGSTSAPGAAGRIRRRRSSSASARHAVVSATTRSPCTSNSRSPSPGGSTSDSMHRQPAPIPARREWTLPSGVVRFKNTERTARTDAVDRCASGRESSRARRRATRSARPRTSRLRSSPRRLC